MKQWQSLALKAAALALAGVVVYFCITRWLKPPVNYVIQPPASVGMSNGAESTFQLLRLTDHIEQMDRGAQYPLTPGQARAMLSVLQPLRVKATLTAEEAKRTTRTLRLILTIEQRTAIGRQAIQQPAAGQSSPGGPPSGGMGGPPPGMGGPPPGGMQGPGSADVPTGPSPRDAAGLQKDFNPFAQQDADAGPGGPAGHVAEFFSFLAQRAAGK